MVLFYLITNRLSKLFCKKMLQKNIKELLVDTINSNRDAGRYADWTQDGYTDTPNITREVAKDIIENLNSYQFHRILNDVVILFDGELFYSIDVGGFLMIGDNPDFFNRIEVGFSNLTENLFDWIQFQYQSKRLLEKIKKQL